MVLSERIRYIDSPPALPGGTRKTYEQFCTFPFDDEARYTLSDVVKPEEIKENWDTCIADFLLGYEVLRLAQLEEPLQQFNSDVLNGVGNISYLRSTVRTHLSQEEQIQTGQPYKLSAVNIIALQWDGIPQNSGRHYGISFGMGVLDSNRIGYFAMRKETDLEADYLDTLTLRNNLLEKKRQYAYIQGPVSDTSAQLYPIIMNGAITNTLYFEHLRTWLHNDLTNTMNSHIRTDDVMFMLPAGVYDAPTIQPFKMLPQLQRPQSEPKQC